MSSNYKKLIEQQAALEAQIQEAHARESAEAIAKIQQLMSDYELTVDDIAGVQQKRRKLGPVEPKYRDPKTGATWSGRGRAPRWIGANRNRYLIK